MTPTIESYNILNPIFKTKILRGEGFKFFINNTLLNTYRL